MTGHLEDFVWAINPLHSSKAGSGCEVKPGWKGQAVLSICVFVPGGTGGHLHASLLIMGMFTSPWGAAPVWRLQGWHEHLTVKGRGNSSRWHRKGRGFCPGLPHGTTNSGQMELIIHHQLLSFPWGVQRSLLPDWEICFFQDGLLSVCFHSLVHFLLSTKSIPWFCIWSLEESSSGNPAIEANLPVGLYPSQLRVLMNFQPNYPKDPRIQTSCSFSSGTHTEIMDFARTSSVYKCKCFEVSNISLRMPRGKPQCAVMGWA